MSSVRKEDPFAGRRIDVPLDIKADDVAPDGSFKGYASVFGIVDQGGDEVQPGAFKASINKAKSEKRLIPMLWQHDRTDPLGTWPSIAEDDKGLAVEGQFVLEDNPPAKRAHSLLKAGALGGMSIGYRIPAGGIIEDAKRAGVYLLKKLDLIEISLVTMPMLIQARVQSVKSMIAGGLRPTVKDLGDVLVELGYPPELAKAVAENSRGLLEQIHDNSGLEEKSSPFYEALGARLSAGF